MRITIKCTISHHLLDKGPTNLAKCWLFHRQINRKPPIAHHHSGWNSEVHTAPHSPGGMAIHPCKNCEEPQKLYAMIILEIRQTIQGFQNTYNNVTKQACVCPKTRSLNMQVYTEKKPSYHTKGLPLSTPHTKELINYKLFVHSHSDKHQHMSHTGLLSMKPELFFLQQTVLNHK